MRKRISNSNKHTLRGFKIKMDDIRKYQHITPKLILNNFAFDVKKKKNKTIYYVYWYKKETNEDIRRATDDICGEKYLYEMRNENNEVDRGANFNITEKALANIEDKIWTPLCKKIIENPSVNLNNNDIASVYMLFTLQLLRTPVGTETTRLFIKKFNETQFNRKLENYVLDQWTKMSIFPFHKLGEKASFASYIWLEKFLKNNRIVIYNINKENTDSRFVLDGEEPIIVHRFEGRTNYFECFYFPISPTICLGLVDDSLLRYNKEILPRPLFFEAQSDFVKQLNASSLALPGRALVSQIPINQNREVLF